jgi:hypothetical protein
LTAKISTKTDIALGNPFGYNPDNAAVDEVVESENEN